MPLMKFERRRGTSPVSSISGMRSSSSSNITRISSLARLAPRQKWGPPLPNATCSLGLRVMSKRNGSSNIVSSRLAEMYQKTTLSPSLICLAAQLDVVGRGAAEVHHRRAPAQHLLDRGADERPVGPQLRELVGVLVQGDHPVRDEVAGGLVAGDREQQEEQVDLEVGEPLAVDLGLGEDADEVVVRVGRACAASSDE